MTQQKTKSQLRRILIEKRQSLAEQVWREKSDRLCRHLQALPQFQAAKTVLAYWSYNREPDLSPLITGDRRWGFPRCVGKSLIWHHWQLGDELQIGAYGITEPSPNLFQIPSTEVDLILVPAVACDRFGSRLGYGGGFYDQMLNSLPWIAKPTIGIVFDFAYLPQLPIDPWDIKLDYVCTD